MTTTLELLISDPSMLPMEQLLVQMFGCGTVAVRITWSGKSFFTFCKIATMSGTVHVILHVWHHVHVEVNQYVFKPSSHSYKGFTPTSLMEVHQRKT